jgi:hypothetical protein
MILAVFTMLVLILGLPFQIRGPAINALILLQTILVGPLAGVTTGCLSPVLSLAWELLSPVLRPALPFMMLANAIFVFSFYYLHKIAGRYLGLLLASLVKYLFFLGSIKYILQNIIPWQMAAIFAVPELFSTLLGGASALVAAQLLTAVFGTNALQDEKKVIRHEG